MTDNSTRLAEALYLLAQMAFVIKRRTTCECLGYGSIGQRADGTLHAESGITQKCARCIVLEKHATLKAAYDAQSAESGAGVTVVSAKPIEWHEQVYAGSKEWTEDRYGFHIVFDPTEPVESEAAFTAWGEGDSENFGTLKEAQEWCQDLIDNWVRSCAVLAAAPEKDHER